MELNGLYVVKGANPLDAGRRGIRVLIEVSVGAHKLVNHTNCVVFSF